MQKIIDILLNILFPQVCFGCKKPHESLCNICLENARATHEEDSAYILFVFHYRNPAIKKAIWAMKYRGNSPVAEVFARELHDVLLGELEERVLFQNFTKPVLVPIPLSKKRLRERGFNQAEKLCKEAIKLDTEKIFEFVPRVLEKIKETPVQTSIKNKRERLKNIKGSFTVRNPEEVRGRNIILIDDIWTTGGTLDEAKRVLLKAGARRIIAITVAH